MNHNEPMTFKNNAANHTVYGDDDPVFDGKQLGIMIVEHEIDDETAVVTYVIGRTVKGLYFCYMKTESEGDISIEGIERNNFCCIVDFFKDEALIDQLYIGMNCGYGTLWTTDEKTGLFVSLIDEEKKQ